MKSDKVELPAMAARDTLFLRTAQLFHRDAFNDLVMVQPTRLDVRRTGAMASSLNFKFDFAFLVIFAVAVLNGSSIYHLMDEQGSTCFIVPCMAGDDLYILLSRGTDDDALEEKDDQLYLH